MNILKLLIDMDARGNKLSSCQIPDQYLKKQKSYWTFRTLDTLAEKKENSKYNRVVITTLKNSLVLQILAKIKLNVRLFKSL